MESNCIGIEFLLHGLCSSTSRPLGATTIARLRLLKARWIFEGVKLLDDGDGLKESVFLWMRGLCETDNIRSACHDFDDDKDLVRGKIKRCIHGMLRAPAAGSDVTDELGWEIEWLLFAGVQESRLIEIFIQEFPELKK